MVAKAAENASALQIINATASGIVGHKTAKISPELELQSKYHYGCSFPEFVPILVGYCLFIRE